ncbi:MauE/DoxX family redox-associated membrane protein [Micromonospora sp. NPDC048170]|uniref:MauE/DoxX family redox-associated membrane protein n=1 Tax=Micromonospora sp. NPDC048170 TaxID=3154819 RepID=UPI0033F3E72B
MQYLALAIRCLIGAVFLTSAVSKVAGPDRFAIFLASVREMRVLPTGLARPAAWVVVAGEFVICGLLVVPAGQAAVAGFTIAAGLLTTFAAAIVGAVRQGRRTSCRCFGPTVAPLGYRHAVRNVALAGFAVVGAMTATASRPTDVGAMLLAAFVGLVLSVPVIALDDIVQLYRASA